MRISFNAICRTPFLLAIFIPTLNKIKHKKNAENPINWNNKSELCDPKLPIQLWIFRLVEAALNEGSEKSKLKSDNKMTIDKMHEMIPKRRNKSFMMVI